MEIGQPFAGASVASGARMAGHPAGPFRHWRTFQTRQKDDPAAVIRTFGTVVQAAAGPLRFADQEALHYAHPAPPPNCARGKVVVFSRHGSWCEAACYQLTDCHTRAQVAACCNATAAAAAWFATATGSLQVSLRVQLPARQRTFVEARVRQQSDAPTPYQAVNQTWSRLPFSIHGESIVDGRRCALFVSPLNNYLLVQGKQGEEPGDFPVSEAVRLGQKFGQGREPLLARIALVQLGPDRPTRARFFTCGEREHPSAPLTGLAVLAIAARRLPWLALPPAEPIQTRARPMALPRVDVFPDGTADVAFPEVLVDLKRGSLPSSRMAQA